MTNPPPRPALKKSADAEIHPARPALAIPLRSLPGESPDPALPTVRGQVKRASTSDTLLGPNTGTDVPAEREKKSKRKDKGKTKSAHKGKGGRSVPAGAASLAPALLAELRAKAAAHGYEADEVVGLLVRAWLDN